MNDEFYPRETSETESRQHVTTTNVHPDADTGTDPYLWLEEVEAEETLTFAREHSVATEEALGGPLFESLRSEILDVLDADDRIPMPVERAGLLYNYWTDAQHERGIWRRTTHESYRTEDPEWEILLDLDAINAAEGASWVWKGAHVLRPSHTRALVFLSPGGTDATVVREFDLTSRTFVPDGFRLPLSKGQGVWGDTTGSTILLAREHGPGSTTSSGYPRTVRRWSRGSSLADAPIVFEGTEDDVTVAVCFDPTEGFERTLVSRATSFHTALTYVVEPDGSLELIDVPASAEVTLHREWLTVQLREPWELPHLTHPAGTLLGIRFEDFRAGSRDFAVLFEPSPTRSLVDAVWTRHQLVLTVLDDVHHRIDVLTPPAAHAEAATALPEAASQAPPPSTGANETGAEVPPLAPIAGRAWRRRPIDLEALRECLGAEGTAAGDRTFLTVSVSAVAPREDDRLWLTTSGFLTPPTLLLLDLDAGGSVSSVEKLKQAPQKFDASQLEVSQHMARSDDGTRVPYFQVSAPGADRTGESPTLLYGYGGFEVPVLPSYSGATGRAWLSRGGVYVVANIRGGGEFGPDWHRSALREHRHRALEDFAAVARDLVERGVTTPGHLGVQGGSNGGLLVGNMLVTHPQSIGAVVCQVPLLDMKRFSHLLAGASWTAEYGDPDVPEDWRFLRTYSPYHLVREDADLPPVLLMTSTRDDRVHPGHARKMTARLEAAGHDVQFWENTEGGHGAAASNAQRATMTALAFAFLWDRLG